MSVVPRITICARAGGAASLRTTMAAKASAITQPASATLRKAVPLVFFMVSIAPHSIFLAENGSNVCFAFGRIRNRVIRGPGRGAQGPPALDQQENADHRPENIAALADDRQGYAGRLGELKDRGDFSGARLVNAHAQRNEFEHDVNNPIDRLKNKSGQERRGQRQADETQRD